MSAPQPTGCCSLGCEKRCDGTSLVMWEITCVQVGAEHPASRKSARAIMTEPSFSRWRHRALLGILILALPIFARGGARIRADVTLSIKNDERNLCAARSSFSLGNQRRRTQSPRAKTATVSMMRGPQPGALYIARFDRRPMMIENIICGADRNWSNSLDQLPLSAVRDSPTSAYQMACRAAPRVVC